MARIDEDRRQADRLVSEAEIQATAKHLAQQFPEVQAIWLFGSYARSEQAATGPVDLAAMTDLWTRENDRLLEPLSNAATNSFGGPVRVEPLGAYLAPERTFEILGRPHIVFARDAEHAAAFASTLRSYARGELEWREWRSLR